MDQIKGSDNVFDDLGFDPVEAADLKVRSGLMIEVTKYIESNGLTQTEAAKLMGVDQPKISALMRGNINLFSINRLIKMAVEGRTQSRCDGESGVK